VNSRKIQSEDLWLLRLEIAEGRKVEMTRAINVKEDMQCQIENSGRKVEEEKSDDLEKILIIDREGNPRTIDLVEEFKDPKQDHNR
jgi:hypothetical protein